MKMLKRIAMCAALLMTSVAMMAQQKVSGVVKDTHGEPVIGATVKEQGSTGGTVTDFDGNYTLTVKSGNAVLEFSYVGYKTQEVKVSGRSTVDITLAEDAELLEEVVVVGYGVQKKQTLTGSVTQVRGDEVLKGKATQNVAAAMQGTIPGLTVTRTSSRPGNEGTNITLRGGISVNSDANNPMILIDGVEAYGWEMSQLNPTDVESISVLKDAAAAIYGTKAAGGVILITTKRGKEGKVQVNYSGSVHANFMGERYPVANGQEWAQMHNMAIEIDAKYGATHSYGWKLGWPEETWRALANGERVVGMVNGAYKILDPFADQFDEVYGTTWGTEQNISINGGNDKVKVMTSLGYASDRSLIDVVYDGQKKYNFRTNLDYKVNDWIKTEFNVAYDHRVTETPTQGVGNGLQDMYLFPFVNEYGQYYDTFGNNNMLAFLNEGGRTTNTEKILRLGGKLTLTLDKLVKGLSLSASANFRLRNGKNIARQTHVTLYDWAGETTSWDGYPDYSQASGSVNFQSKDENCWVKNTLYDTFLQTYNALVNYNRTFGDHTIGMMAGITGEKSRYEKYYMYRKGMTVDELDDINLGDVTTSEATGGRNEVGMISWLGRLNYDYKGIYLLEGLFRRDGSSRFSSANRWANFYGLSAGVRLSELNFVKKWNIFDNLKLRASYGETGSQGGIGNYDYYSTIGTGSTIFGYNGTKANTAWISGMTSENRTWERVATTNFGIDFAVLKNRLSGSFEYYIRNNNDMLIAVSYPATLGASAPKTNNGSFRANGWELQLNWRDKIGKEFEYSVGLSLSDAKTEITKFDGAVAIAAGYNNTVGGSAFIEGKPLNALYVYRTNGIMQTQEEVDAYYPTVNASGTKAPTQGTDSQLRPGCVRKVDLNNDGKITTDDLDYYGDANPHWQFGITLGAKWKGLDFSMFIQGVGSMNLVRTGNLSGPFRSWWMNQNRTYLTETWREDNTGAQFPILSFNGDLVTWNYSDYNDINVMNCWYARAKNISLGYTLPQKLVNRVHLSNLRVYVSADNLFSINNVADNFDPEIQAATGQGKIDCYSRTVSFGVDLTF